MSIGRLTVEDVGLWLPRPLHTFVRAAIATVEGDSITVRQYPHVCIFCGAVALYELHGLGICENCKDGLLTKLRDSWKERK